MVIQRLDEIALTASISDGLSNEDSFSEVIMRSRSLYPSQELNHVDLFEGNASLNLSENRGVIKRQSLRESAQIWKMFPLFDLFMIFFMIIFIGILANLSGLKGVGEHLMERVGLLLKIV